MERVFIYTYVTGIIVAMLLAVTGGQMVIFGQAYVDDFSRYILPFSLTHMLVLIFMGYRFPKALRIIPGERVQTAGYLHTLIGFSAALLHVSTQDFNISEIMGPLGSALITSILGWFAGGELLSSVPDKSATGVKGEMGRLAVELEGFTKAVKAAHTTYITTINGASEEYIKLQEKQKEVISGSTKGLNEVENTLRRLNTSYRDLLDSVEQASKELSKNFGDEFEKATQQVLANAKSHANALHGAAHEAENTRKYLAESRVLIAELEKLINYVAKLKD